MSRFESFIRLFKSGDEKVQTDFLNVFPELPLSPPEKSKCDLLLKGFGKFVKKLSGEQETALLLSSNENPNQRAVLKSYTPGADIISGEAIDHGDRLELLREEEAAYIVSLYFPLLKVPTTVITTMSQADAKAWKLPQVYSSDGSVDTSWPKAAMLQEHVEDARMYASMVRPLTEVAAPVEVFGQLLFDYLIAYGDGRFGNLLVKKGSLIAIDHGGSFRSKGKISNLKLMGISDEYQIEGEELAALRAKLDPDKAKKAVAVLETILGRKKNLDFTVRFASLHKLLADRNSLTAGELRQALA